MNLSALAWADERKGRTVGLGLNGLGWRSFGIRGMKSGESNADLSAFAGECEVASIARCRVGGCVELFQAQTWPAIQSMAGRVHSGTISRKALSISLQSCLGCDSPDPLTPAAIVF